MVFKIMGVICIVLSGSMMGIYFSKKEKIHMNELIDIKKALLILKSQIDYCCEALPEALHNIAIRSQPPIKTIFENISRELISKNDRGVAIIWSEEFYKSSPNMNLSKYDLETITSFGKNLGYLDKNLQINNIDMIVEYIDTTVKAITRKQEKDGKMYRSLGVLLGMLLALLLI